MAEEIVEQEIEETPEVDEEDVDYGPPRGTVAFVTLMIVGYIIYYGIHYVEIFILRGA